MEPRDTLGHRVGYQMKRAEHSLRLEMDDALRELGLTTPQYAALSVLAEGPGLSGAEVARRCFVTPQTMNGVLVKLEGAGLVSRRAHPEHGRVLQAYPTRKGEELLVRAHRAVVQIEERMLSGLERDDHLRLLEALRSCADSLGAGERGRISRAMRGV